MILLFYGCKSDSDSDGSNGTLTLISDHEINNVKDPSGLTLDSSRQFLWVVSDNKDGLVYRINFRGDLIGTLSYRGDDMEGITMNPNDGTFWVVEERLRQMVQLDGRGNELQREDVPGLIIVEGNGLEGIAIDPIMEHFYIINEKIPAEFIELDNEFKVVRQIPIQFGSEYQLDDLSGIFYVSEDREFWILSDESKRIVITDFNLNPLRSYELGREKFEGIAVDDSSGRVYLVNDEENKLYVYSYE